MAGGRGSVVVGQDEIDNTADGKAYIWEDCATGRWNFRVTGDGDNTVRHRGRIDIHIDVDFGRFVAHAQKYRSVRILECIGTI